MDQNWTQKLPFYNNRVLFGHDATPSLIAFEVEGSDKIRIFSRQGDQTYSESVSFQPLLLLSYSVQFPPGEVR